ncbi:MAG: hypothetical protein IJX47_04105 [Clostridia bacterium]|nr:hypothetical protein [Clostridia bacterium]
MNEKTEKEIIALYIAERKAERILYELLHPKKREQCIWTLSRYFRDNVKTRIDKHQATTQEIVRQMRDCGYENERCYLLSVDPTVDGTERSLPEALTIADNASPMLVYSPAHKLAYWQGEENLSDTERMILRQG